jgi:hypothetical protein
MRNLLVAAILSLHACAETPSAGMTKAVNDIPHSSELADRMRAVYAAMTAGDAQRVEALYSLARGSVFIGTSEAEFWTDSAKHNADVRPHWKPGNVGVDAGEIHAVVMGETGLSVDRPTFRLRDGTSFKLRLTFVWRREAGEWKVIHSHASVAAS